MIPEHLEQETFLLEYLPGTYGDYVSGIVSYSVDGFLDPCEPHLSDGEEKYWNANNAIVARNKFPLSLRGGGHEHVLDYSEFMLAHHTFLHFNSFLHIPSPEKYKLLFNTHTYIVDPLRLRTMHNAFTDTKTNCLTIKDDFDIVFTSTCNEYFTSHKDKEFDIVTGRVTATLANMYIKLVERYSQRANWRGYTYIDEMRGQALLQLTQIGLQFNEAKSDNPFAYYTAAVNNSFTRVLNIEKKNQGIRDDLLENSGQAPSWTRQLEHEMKSSERWQKVIKTKITDEAIPTETIKEIYADND